MENNQPQNLKKNIIAIGRLLWEKNLVTGLNGNISLRVDNGTIALTGHETCLGLLQESDILHMRLDGEVLDKGNVSSEKLLHTEIYKNFPEAAAVIHTHTTYTSAYFLRNKSLTPQIFESKMYLGNIQSVEQNSPAVTDIAPVIEALKSNNIAVLRNHGVVAKGRGLFDCFLLIQALEEAVTIDAISRLYPQDIKVETRLGSRSKASSGTKKYKLFSQEQIDQIVKVVNDDQQMKELGSKTKMTMDLAVQMEETGATYRFTFKDGRITDVGNQSDAEFLITAPESVWRAVFKREIDPFVATTQKKMNLKGDFAKISRWYAPCSRIFELWGTIPVE
ncbi:MAG: class II aldolase/adducin family protein [Candidatus Omnitrophica bacterium]|nr:class II aldolase/adducin family protein [Candidatus Omnitrophota bacterium]